MKKDLNQELVMINKDNKDLESSTKCCIFYNVYVEGDVKVRDQ